jgi:hypothetical protein
MNPFFRRHTGLTTAVDHLAELIEQKEENTSTWQRSIQVVLKEVERGATPEEIKQAQQRMADMMQNIPLIVASFFAICSGALVERGADADIPAQAIFQRIHAALILATRFSQAYLEEARQHQAGNEQNEDQEKEQDRVDPEACVQEYAPSLAGKMTEEFLGWKALDFCTRASVALVLCSPQQRAIARSNVALMKALQRCPADSTLRCLRVALNLLENEEIIVLHPELQRGYRIRINHLGLNFELHTLLADTLIGDPAQGWLPGQKPDPRVAAAAKDGPFPMPGDTKANQFPQAKGIFNLWNWRGLQPDGRLPGGFDGREHWIWNEGQPADIEPFEGTRIILLSPPPYHRFWNAGRFFPQLPGELEVLEKLPEEQVRAWLTRIAAAVEAREQES